MQESGHIYDKKFDTCITKETFIEKYPEAIAGLHEFCGTTAKGLPKACDEQKNMICQDRECRCTKDFYPVESTPAYCESKQVFVKKHNLTSYKVIHGVYCYNNYDCITGLICYRNKCACKYRCVYDETTQSCDCKEETEWWQDDRGQPLWKHRLFQIVIVVSICGIFFLLFCAKAIHSRHPLSSARKQHNPKIVYAPDEYKPVAEPYRIKYRMNPEPEQRRPSVSDPIDKDPKPSPSPFPTSPLSRSFKPGPKVVGSFSNVKDAIDWAKSQSEAMDSTSDLYKGGISSYDPSAPSDYSAPYVPSAPSDYSAPTITSTTAQIENPSYHDSDIETSNNLPDIYKPIIF